MERELKLKVRDLLEATKQSGLDLPKREKLMQLATWANVLQGTVVRRVRQTPAVLRALAHGALDVAVPIRIRTVAYTVKVGRATTEELSALEHGGASLSRWTWRHIPQPFEGIPDFSRSRWCLWHKGVTLGIAASQHRAMGSPPVAPYLHEVQHAVLEVSLSCS